MKRIKVTNKDVIIPFVTILGVNVLVLSLWTGLSPLIWDRFNVGTVDRYGRNLESVGMCVGEAKGWAPYASVLLFINAAMVGLASFQAYRARKISVEYSESKWIAIILVAFLEAMAIGVPLIALVYRNPAANFVVRAGLVGILCITILLAMFVPKFFHLKDARIEAAKKQTRLEASAARRGAFREACAAAEESDTGTPNMRQTSEKKFRTSGLKVLFHPETHVEEMEALKDELTKSKEELQSFRRQRDSVETQNSISQKQGTERFSLNGTIGNGYDEFLQYLTSNN